MSSTPPTADRHQQLRVFFSADLVNGTDFKNRRPAEVGRRGDDQPPWPSRFEAFFREFARDFALGVKDTREGKPHGESILAVPVLWKLSGDEILFNELVYPDERDLFVALATSVRAFVALVQRFDEDLLPEGMGLRGSVWTAGFPIRNRKVRVLQGSDIGIIPRQERDFDTGDYPMQPAVVTDYIGRDMDLGFRLAATTPPGRVCCSLDVAERLTNSSEDDVVAFQPPHVFHVGWRRLKGISEGNPYPLFWLDLTKTPARRHPWEGDDEHTSPETQHVLASPSTALCSGAYVRELAEHLRAQFPHHYIKAYASDKHMARAHWRFHEDHEDASTIEVGAGSAQSAAPHVVPTITLDDLNQLQVILQSEPERVAALEDILQQIANHTAYAKWKATDQFASRLFTLPNDLTFTGDNQRRLLETLGLVIDDVLRVKVNAGDKGVYITDGLWVKGDIRAFPFCDESDLLLRACSEQGWQDWATCLVDPATGPGHNVLRYGNGDATPRRCGFDVNARALGYAAVNAAVNGKHGALLGINDIRQGLPPVFRQHGSDRVLVLANMPIALAPVPDTLPRSAEGGMRGYELTIKALEAVRGLRDALSAESELRCIVLTYTLGNKARDRWYVPEYAKKLFGADHVTWRLWDEEMLWRINGKKEQANPMPLESLELKADCRFYVREEAHRPTIRRGYRRLCETLKREGHDHLAYGVVIVD